MDRPPRLLLLAASIVTISLGSLTQSSAQKRSRTVTSVDVDNMMKSLSNWGRWGLSDQLGAINLITREKRRQAAALVREGLSISMAHNAIKDRSDSSPPFDHRMVETGTDARNLSSSDYVGVQYHGYTQTHLDALCHLFHNGRMYNGFPQSAVSSTGAQKLGVEMMKNGLFTRAVLMDIPKLLGMKYLKGRHAIYPEDLEAWEKKAGVRVGAGDAILIRTGRWARRASEGSWDIENNSAGLHASCLPWLKQRDVAVLGSDLASDVMPSGIDKYKLPVHWVSVVAMGVPILDNCDFESVSEAGEKRRRWEFLLTVAPLAVEGGTGSPVNPIAVF